MRLYINTSTKGRIARNRSYTMTEERGKQANGLKYPPDPPQTATNIAYYLEKAAKKSRAGFDRVHMQLLAAFRTQETSDSTVPSCTRVLATLSGKSTFYSASVEEGTCTRNVAKSTKLEKSLSSEDEHQDVPILTGNSTFYSTSQDSIKLEISSVKSTLSCKPTPLDVKSVAIERISNASLAEEQDVNLYSTLVNKEALTKEAKDGGRSDPVSDTTEVVLRAKHGSAAAPFEEDVSDIMSTPEDRHFSRNHFSLPIILVKPINTSNQIGSLRGQLASPANDISVCTSVPGNNVQCTSVLNEKTIYTNETDPSKGIPPDHALCTALGTHTVQRTSSQSQSVHEKTVTSKTQPGNDFFSFSVPEVAQCLEFCGLGAFAALCNNELLDGSFFQDFDEIPWESEPFNLSQFHIFKLKKIIAGWRPMKKPKSKK